MERSESERIMMESYAASMRAAAASSLPAWRSFELRAFRNCAGGRKGESRTRSDSAFRPGGEMRNCRRIQIHSRIDRGVTAQSITHSHSTTGLAGNPIHPHLFCTGIRIHTQNLCKTRETGGR